jgi:hypothetical protein
MWVAATLHVDVQNFSFIGQLSVEVMLLHQGHAFGAVE